MWINSEIMSLGLVYFSGLIFKGKGFINADSRGFGDDMSWKRLDDGLIEAKSNRLPIMMIIHKSWCPACKALKPVVSSCEEIKELSKSFIMVNTVDDEEPKDKKFAPDGPYIPRILFLDHNGEVMTDYYNDLGNPSYRYFYRDSNSIVRSMKKVLHAYGFGPFQPPQGRSKFVSDIYEDVYSHTEL